MAFSTAGDGPNSAPHLMPQILPTLRANHTPVVMFSVDIQRPAANGALLAKRRWSWHSWFLSVNPF